LERPIQKICLDSLDFSLSQDAQSAEQYFNLMQKLLLRQISEENFKLMFTRIDGELDKLIYLE